MSTAAATDPPGLDLTALRSYLDHAAPGLVNGRLTGDLLVGGKSNLTYQVGDGIGRWVVRRPPLGHVLATAHDMAREYRVLCALGPTVIPVPETLLLCEDTDVLGAPFYLMEYVDGTVYREAADLAALPPERVHALAMSIVDTLADLHNLDPAAIGLGDFGRPDGFNERQVRRWKRQLDGSRSRELAGIDELHARLAEAVPPSGAGTVVHGDYRLSNVLIGPDDRPSAVLDWEMSTLGDPLGDLGLMLLYTGAELPAATGDRSVTSVPGHPDIAGMVGRYAERGGRDVTTLRWYIAFAAFKLAVILEGVYYRYRGGQTVGEGFDHVGEQVPGLVAIGHDTLDGRGRFGQA
jgi:aminoglycoside phosphotransferase (APT) family kinase protein